MKGRTWYQADEVAEEYEEKRFSRGGRLIDEREKRAVFDALGSVEGRSVLEIACGTGRFTVELAARDADVVGLDISEAMLRQGRLKATQLGVEDHLEFLRGDAGRLPFPDDHFDAVMAMRFFHLADTPARFLEEMARVSRGQVIFDTFNDRSARTLYNWLLPMGSRLYSDADVRQLLDGIGLTLRDVEHDFVGPYGFYRKVPDWLASPLRRLDASFVETPVGEPLASVSYWNAEV